MNVSNKEIDLELVEDNPDKRLVAAVIRRAIDDLFLPKNSPAIKEYERKSAYEYLFVDDGSIADYAFSFRRCCSALDLNVDAVRSALKPRYEQFLSSTTPIKIRKEIHYVSRDFQKKERCNKDSINRRRSGHAVECLQDS